MEGKAAYVGLRLNSSLKLLLAFFPPELGGDGEFSG